MIPHIFKYVKILGGIKMEEEKGYVMLKRFIEKFDIECEYCGENINNNRNITQLTIVMRGADDKILSDISFSTEGYEISDLSDSKLKDYCYDSIKDDFEMENSEQDKYKFFMENSEIDFIEEDLYMLEGEVLERAIKSIKVECIALVDQEDCEEKGYTINAKVIGYDDEEYWSIEDEEIMVNIEEGDNEEEQANDEVMNVLIEKCDLGISENFIEDNADINI